MATMLPMPTQIELYQEMSTLSAQMVEAARAGDWDNLVILEHKVGALRETLMNDSMGNAPAPAEIGIRRALIQRILDDDAEIRRHTEPWMEHARQFLGASNRRHQIERAYGAASTG